MKRATLAFVCLLAVAKDPVEDYKAEALKTILELQQFRRESSIRIKAKSDKQGSATLVDLNPAINIWYLLKVAWPDVPEAAYHLENPKPGAQKLVFDDKYLSGLVIVSGKNRYACDLFSGDSLPQAKASQLIYQPLCEGRIYLRNAATGHRTNLEAATDFLRDRVWGGESIIALGHHIMGDSNRETGKIESSSQPANAKGAPNLPRAAQIDPKYADRLLTSANLEIGREGADKKGMTPGAWYPASGNPGIYVSILQPNLIDPAILATNRKTVSALDSGESASMCYLIALDVEQFDLGFSLGTEHPRVDWSNHMPDQMRNAKLPGPDGIDNIAPLVSTGLISPENGQRTVAAFTAGFKRAHGAFKYGELALKNRGSHYGFVENGVVFSKLQPGLSTIVVFEDNSIMMKTWSEADNKLLPRIKHARQNGVPLIEFDEASKSPIPGPLVANWGAGNWSGSEDRKLRTMRSGTALQRNNGKRFLIYAVFSSATPSAMARIFQAYRCDYAMELDINALEHTYCALYRRSGAKLSIDHLILGMNQVDKPARSAELLPRFLAFPDNRDFFYVMRRERQEVKR